jgi:hypothetical protein
MASLWWKAQVVTVWAPLHMAPFENNGALVLATVAALERLGGALVVLQLPSVVVELLLQLLLALALLGLHGAMLLRESRQEQLLHPS